MNELEISKLYSEKLGLSHVELEFTSEQTRKILGIGQDLLAKKKREGELLYRSNGNRHMFLAVDIYASQHRHRDQQVFKKDQVSA